MRLKLISCCEEKESVGVEWLDLKLSRWEKGNNMGELFDCLLRNFF